MKTNDAMQSSRRRLLQCAVGLALAARPLGTRAAEARKALGLKP